MSKPRFAQGSDYAFDATKEHTFYYIWASTNNQSVGSVLTIRNNVTNEIVYSQQQGNLLLRHTLPANTLTNGVLYNATIKVYDVNNVMSDDSDSILFYCYSTPTFNISIVSDVVNSSSCSVGISYSQSEGEELQVFRVELYNSFKELLSTSSLRYDATSVVIFNGLNDNATYYVKAIGQTINHMSIETDMVDFTVNYISPILYSYVSIENRPTYGDIQFSSNIVSIEGRTADYSNAVFVDNEFVDTINGASVKFDENFTIQKDFFMSLIGKSFIIDEKILTMSNGKATIELIWRKDIDEKYFIELDIYQGDVHLMIFSNHIDYSDGDVVVINLKSNSFYFDIAIQKEVST